jgi:D-arabinitol 4-dehydrogenase
MVDSVLPYEEAKIRILNASHSCIAWAGTLVGLEFIHEGTDEDEIREMAFDYVTDDVIPCLSPSPLNLAEYRDVVLDRFSNPYIKDTNQRVTADGFSKIPGFIVPTLTELLERRMSLAATAMLPALYYVFLMRWHRDQLPYAYQDGVMDAAAAHAMLNSPDPVGAFCAERQLWGKLTGNADLEAAIRAAVVRVDEWLASRDD